MKFVYRKLSDMTPKEKFSQPAIARVAAFVTSTSVTFCEDLGCLPTGILAFRSRVP